MNEQQFGKRIKHYLNQSLDLTPAQAERLRAAREQALARQRVVQNELVPAWAGRVAGPRGAGPFVVRWVLPILIAAAALFGFQQWQTSQGLDEDPLAEVDTQILKGDLPIDAFIDKGFRQYLQGDEE